MDFFAELSPRQLQTSFSIRLPRQRLDQEHVPLGAEGRRPARAAAPAEEQVRADGDGDRGEHCDDGGVLGEARRARHLALPPLHLHRQHGHLRRLLHRHEVLLEVGTLISI